MKPDEYDPEATVWRAVAELERKHFTKAEIADALFEAEATLVRESLPR